MRFPRQIVKQQAMNVFGWYLDSLINRIAPRTLSPKRSPHERAQKKNYFYMYIITKIVAPALNPPLRSLSISVRSWFIRDSVRCKRFLTSRPGDKGGFGVILWMSTLSSAFHYSFNISGFFFLLLGKQNNLIESTTSAPPTAEQHKHITRTHFYCVEIIFNAANQWFDSFFFLSFFLVVIHFHFCKMLPIFLHIFPVSVQSTRSSTCACCA